MGRAVDVPWRLWLQKPTLLLFKREVALLLLRKAQVRSFPIGKGTAREGKER
jgi:hypothetical protein